MSKRERPGTHTPDTRRVFCARSDRRAMLLDERAIDREYDSARAYLDDDSDRDGFTPVRLDPDASWSPVAYRRSDAGVAVVMICGPLEHHGGGYWFDAYDAISCRVACALADSEVKAVVLRIDSPGGVANGMVETSRDIRSAAAERGVALYAYADEQMTSAAYGLACAADEIWCPETGEVGSVGVILPVLDWTRANEKQGIRTALLTTGKRKGDGHPDKPLDDDVRDALQTRVDAIGTSFFALVAESRGVKPAAVEKLEAGVYIGAAAQDVGLVDGVAGWRAFLSIVESSIGGNSSAIGSASKAGKKSVDKSLKSATTATISTEIVGASARRKDSRMSVKLLDLVKAKDSAQAALMKAQEVKDERKRAKAVEAASGLLASALADLTAVARYDAKMKVWKKTTKIEEDDGCDGGDDTSTPDSDVDTGAEDPDKSEEDEEDEDDAAEKKSAKASKASAHDGAPRGYLDDSLHTPKRLLAHVRQLTGERDLPTAMDRLSEMAAQASAYPDLSRRLEKIETSGRTAKVKAMVDEAIADGRAFKAQRDSLVAMGMKSRDHLRSFLATSPKRIVTRESDLAAPAASAKSSHASLAHLSTAAADATLKVAQFVAQSQKIDLDAAIAQVLEEQKKNGAAATGSN